MYGYVGEMEEIVFQFSKIKHIFRFFFLKQAFLLLTPWAAQEESDEWEVEESKGGEAEERRIVASTLKESLMFF